MIGGILLLPFYLRILLFFIIWGFIFISTDKQTDVYLLFFCAFSLAIYFLIPILKKKILFILLLQWTTLFYGFIYEENIILLFLSLNLLYFLELTFYSSLKVYRVQLSIMSLVLIVVLFTILSWEEATQITAATGLIGIILACFKDYLHQTKNHATLYEKLLGEYRQIKRQAMDKEKSARIEERARIAREMHDSVGHRLTALGMQIEMLLMKEENEVLRSMKNTVNESLEETRKAVRALSIEEIEGISSVIQLIRKLESESQMRIHFTTKQGTLSISLSNSSSIVLYRVLQESLTNAMKYGTSKEVFITLGISPIGQLTFEIKNKYDNTKPFHEGFGLRNMRERVEKISGWINFYRLDDLFITEGTIPVEEEGGK